MAEPVVVFAAASLSDVIEEVARDFERETGLDITASYAGSALLARQIARGAPADLFISAHVDWMDDLQDKALISPDTRIDLLSNQLVLIGPNPQSEVVDLATFDFSAALADGYIAMGLLGAVPAGIYGEAALRSLGKWEEVKSRVAQADNARAALALVASGAAPVGIVYATDAAADDRVSVIGTFSNESHPQIVYPAAVIEAGDGGSAKVFLDYLSGPQAQTVFERAGFVPVGAQ